MLTALDVALIAAVSIQVVVVTGCNTTVEGITVTSFKGTIPTEWDIAPS